MRVSGYFCAIWLLFYPNYSSCTSCNDFSAFLKNISSALNQVGDNIKSCKERPGARDCSQLFNEGNTKSGIYRIWPLNWEMYGSFNVYCDMDNHGGGWTIIQRRGSYNLPKDYFFRNWADYRMGFGKLNKEFWLGNDRIFALTNQDKYILRIDMKTKEGEKRFAAYQEFWIENGRQLFILHVSGYNGDAGDSFSNMNEMKFSTKDSDNDIHYEDNCADKFKGGWWYTNCHESNLNGLNLNGPHESYADGIEWKAWKGYHYSLSHVEMKIRPISPTNSTFL